MHVLPTTNAAYVASLAHQLRTETQTTEQATQWAWWLLEKATDSSMAMLIAHPRQLTAAEIQSITTWVKEICIEHKPIAYILGSVPFGPLEITVKPPILIPRAETEFWVDAIAAEYLKANAQPLEILDIGTGSGCIALLLAKTINAQVTGIDVNLAAVTLAQHNAKQNKLTNAHFLQSNLFSALDTEQQFDCIVTNPPYISLDKSLEIEQSVHHWEDHTALFSENNGLAHIEYIITHAPDYLRCHCRHPLAPQKQLCIEIDHDQAHKVVQMLTYHGYTNVVVMQDQYQRDRVVCASKGCFCPKKDPVQNIS